MERTDAEAEAPILWLPDSKSWLISKDPDAGKDWRPKEKGMTENEMVGWYHQLNGHEFEQALGVGDRQGSLAYCSPWGCKKLDTTEWLNWTELNKVDDYLNLFVKKAHDMDRFNWPGLGEIKQKKHQMRKHRFWKHLVMKIFVFQWWSLDNLKTT